MWEPHLPSEKLVPRREEFGLTQPVGRWQGLGGKTPLHWGASHSPRLWSQHTGSVRDAMVGIKETGRTCRGRQCPDAQAGLQGPLKRGQGVSVNPEMASQRRLDLPLLLHQGFWAAPAGKNFLGTGGQSHYHSGRCRLRLPCACLEH